MDITKYNTLESILDITGDVNSAIVRREDFSKTKIFKDVMLRTKCLDVFKDISFSQRVMFLVQNLEIRKCPKCGDLYVFFPKSSRTFALCKHKKNVSVDHSKQSTDRIARMNKSFCEQINDGRLRLTEEEFNNKMSEMSLKKENYAFLISKDNFDFYHDCVAKTINMIEFDEKDFKMSERIFCLANRICSIPKCRFCGKEVKFLNRVKGYQDTCSDCSELKSNETRSKNIRDQIHELIDQSKYEIISYPTLLNLQPLVIKCKKCNKISEWYLNNGHLNCQDLFDRLCRHCESVASRGEEEVFQFLKSIYSEEIIHKIGGRKIIPPKELDIYIPEKRLAIEYNGIYWHQSDIEESIDEKHVDKTNMCERKGIQLIQIFEDSWIQSKKLIQSKLKNLFGIYDKTVFARNCEVREIVDNDLAKKFLDENHLQGNIGAKVKIGLFYNDDLVAMMTFGKPRFDKKHQWEMIRYCSKAGYHIPGAAGKLLKHFERTYKPDNLVSYADRCWSTGKMYKALGFELTGVSKPNYWYVRGTVRLSRIKCQKHRLHLLLENYDEKLSEFQNMKRNGYYKIFDCGNLVFEKKYGS